MHQLLLLACGMCAARGWKLGPSYVLTNPTDEIPRDHCGNKGFPNEWLGHHNIIFLN